MVPSLTATEEDTAQSRTATNECLPRSAIEKQYHRLLTEHGPALLRLAGSYTNTVSDRDDLLQEIALAIWRSLPGFRGESSERTFVFRIGHNRGIAQLAKHRMVSMPPDEEALLPDKGPSPEQELTRQQERWRLLEAIRKLPVPYRQVMTLALEDFDYAEMAQVLGVSESNVGVRLSRARQMLRDLMEQK